MHRFDEDRRRILLGAATWMAGSALAAETLAATRPDLDLAADSTLALLRKSQPASVDLIRKARGVLVFPDIIKGGLLIGAATGEGVLRVGGKTSGYYRTDAVSYGLQIGITKFGYVMLLMDAKSLDFLRNANVWEVGVGPRVTVADQGFAKKLATNSNLEGIYVFFVGQEGFFAGAGIEGARITEISG